MTRYLAIIGACALAIVGGFVWGRLTARPKTVEVVRTVEAKKTEEKRVSTVTGERTNEHTRTRTRYVVVRQPDGTVRTTSERTDSRNDSAERTVANSAIVAASETREATQTIPAPQAARERWQLGVTGSIGMAGAYGYGPVVGRRIGQSPFWLTVGANIPQKAAQVGIAVTW